MARTIWRDGEFVAWEDATVHVLSQSLQRGSLVFDYISVHDNPKGVAIFRLADHIDRLITSCSLVGLPLAFGRDELIEACAEAVRRNEGAKSIKISALIPSIEVEIVPQDPTVSVFIAAYDGAADIIAKNKGEYRARTELKLKVERNKHARRDDIMPPQAKVAANYTPTIAAKWRAREEGFDDILLLDENGWVSEGPTSNLFLVSDAGGVVTPPDDKVLLGITRASMMEIAPSIGVPCEVRDVNEDELLAAPEVFMTATSIGIWPVLQIDDHVVGNGEPGVVTTRLRDTFRAITRGEVAEFEHWLHYV